jgi:hypothetical protein
MEGKKVFFSVKKFRRREFRLEAKAWKFCLVLRRLFDRTFSLPVALYNAKFGRHGRRVAMVALHVEVEAGGRRIFVRKMGGRTFEPSTTSMKTKVLWTILSCSELYKATKISECSFRTNIFRTKQSSFSLSWFRPRSTRPFENDFCCSGQSTETSFSSSLKVHHLRWKGLEIRHFLIGWWNY